MYGALPYYTIGLLFIDFHLCGAFNASNFQILFYEYGTHLEGEELSHSYNGYIPALKVDYQYNATPTRADLEKRFTYLRVEYISPLSKADIQFNPRTMLITFHIKFPFVEIPFGVVGYSMKILRTRVWDSWTD